MSDHSLSHLHLSDEDIETISQLVKYACQAYRDAGYPSHYYKAFLKTLQTLEHFGAIAVLKQVIALQERGRPIEAKAYHRRYSSLQDKLSHLTRQIG